MNTLKHTTADVHSKRSLKSDQTIYCILDYETYSEADLKKVGAFEYSMHPSTEIICVSWTIGTRKDFRNGTAKKGSWAPLLSTPSETFCISDHALDGWQYKGPGDFVQALMDPKIIFVAHNALFEQVITRNVLGRKYFYKERWEPIRKISPRRWICTASMASALALPRKLEHAAQALKLAVQKDMEGHRLMMKMSKPRTPTKNNPSTRHIDEDDIERLILYCQTDIETEIRLFLNARPLSADEREVWILDQKINLRGFKVDRELVQTTLKMIDEETRFLNELCEELTLGQLRSATQRDGVLKYLESVGTFLPNLQAKTVDDALESGLADGHAAEILRIRQAVSKTSTAKYIAFEARSRTDGRIRDILMYHAASTGRWGGAGVQPQNFPRGTMKGWEEILNKETGKYEWKKSRNLAIGAPDIFKTGNLELVRLIYGDPMQIFSDSLRSCIIAPAGKTFDVADYASIEVRVLFWIAGDLDGVKAFMEGRDLYKELAGDIYSEHVAKITPDQRFTGKTATLGCGYQMGWQKFKLTCKQQGQEIDDNLAKLSVEAYRTRHRPVTSLWKNVEYAAIAAVESPGKVFTVKGADGVPRVSFQTRRDFLWCKLPSGRELAYSTPTIRMEPTAWGEIKPKLYHYGVDSLTKKWVNQSTYGGKLVENIVQGVARDLMAGAMLRIEKAGPWKIVLSVHDELIAERDVFSNGTNAEFCRLMEVLPPWAEGCPVKAEGWEGGRYKK